MVSTRQMTTTTSSSSNNGGNNGSGSSSTIVDDTPIDAEVISSVSQQQQPLATTASAASTSAGSSLIGTSVGNASASVVVELSASNIPSEVSLGVCIDGSHPIAPMPTTSMHNRNHHHHQRTDTVANSTYLSDRARAPAMQQFRAPLRSRSSTRIRPKNLLDLPMEMLEQIFSYVGYKKVSQIRVVSKSMNAVCSAILNSTFSKLSTNLMNRFRLIKNNMPRRESSRRTHPLSYECDIVETCYMRVSLLQMTFGKHMDRKHICFFAGAILDEVFHILAEIRNSPNIRPHTMTEELYDLSTMAMEYFKEHLEPRLPPLMPVMSRSSFVDHSKNNTKTKYLLDTTTPGNATCNIATSGGGVDSDAESCAAIAEDDDIVAVPPQSNMVLRKGIRKIKQGMKRYNNQLTVLRNDLRYCKRKATDQQKMMTEMQKLIAEQQKQTVEYAARLDENDKKNEEMSMKISALLQESNKCKTELQYWRSKGRAPVDDQLPDAATADAGPNDGLDIQAEHVMLDEASADTDFEAAADAPSAASSAIDNEVIGGLVTMATIEQVQIECGGAVNCVVAHHTGDRTDDSNGLGGSAIVMLPTVICSIGQPATQHPQSPSTWTTTTTTPTTIHIINNNSSSNVGVKRKADDSTTVASAVASMISSSSGGCVGGVSGGASTEALPHNSDIIKKARRVQSKARSQHPLSISSSCSSNSTNTGNIGSTGNGSSSFSNQSRR